MQRQSRAYIWQILRNERERHGFHRILLWLSVIVVFAVFWNLKLTGITMAGEAFCGKAEHVHSEECSKRPLICGLEETGEHIHSESCYGEPEVCTLEAHIHEANCYSNINADLETEEIWRASIGDIIPGASTKEKVMLIAQSQLGYRESTLNFQVDASGVRRGITRYGQWYGNPYGDWSSMFAAFCMHYAGVEDVTFNAGTEAMRLEWAEAGRYQTADAYAPRVGDLLFLVRGATPIDLITTVPAAETVSDETIPDETVPDETVPNETLPAETLPEGAGLGDTNGAVAVAVITGVFDHAVTVIAGDVDGAVAEQTYSITDPAILGYGLVPETSPRVVMMAAPPGMTTAAYATTYSSALLNTASNRFVFYVESGGAFYAFDGSGNVVPIQVDADGAIHVAGDPNRILWSVSRYNNNSWAIQNAATGRYLHPYYNGTTDNGITTPGRWGTTMSGDNGGVKFSHSAYISFDPGSQTFAMTRNQSQNQTFRVGVAQSCTVWLDGTNGGIMGLMGSDDTAYTVNTGYVMTLPTEWKSPEKYAYVLRGWYDVVNNVYYKPGEQVTILGNTVFYADWQAASYDLGQFNNLVAEDTVSTDHFITTRMFDYGVLMNLLSTRASVSVDASGHSETWSLITDGNNPYNGDPTLNFILRDWDRGNEDISYPSGHNDRNNPTDAGEVYPGLYTDAIRDAFFDPDVELPGKIYLGEADYLFQLCLDPTHDHYGYYYYNSERNAASFNQSEGRFYVYDYLECTIDSYNSGNEGKYSDFLPFNSPYVDTNGKNINTYTYEGIEGEYAGTTHYRYDSRYNTDGSSAANVGANFWYGMVMDVDFYLPNKPGTQVNGEYGNQDIYGKDMHFRFTGDDDVWIIIDGRMVLDLGGLHGCEQGDINFSTGVVSVNGVPNEALTQTLRSLDAGDHRLTLYYLERGSSMSNCAIYFNLAPRFAFSIQKEDVLTRDVLNGAQFSVYTDKDCTVPAELWVSKESHDNGDDPTNVFTVTDGEATMWGMGASNTYYIKETKPPDKEGYGFPNGLISLAFDQLGTANYNVEIVDAGEGVSPGFLVHGLRVDAEAQQAYIVATNAPEWVKEVTSVQVMKHWLDTQDHSSQTVPVYLTVTDPDGTVRRLQELTLSSGNNWTGIWENLPKYLEDGKTPVAYGVEEAYVSGYYSTVEKAEGQFVLTRTEWRNVTAFEDGKVYILKNTSGQALSTQRSAEDVGYMWVSEETAQSSPLALWTASVQNGTVRLTNQAGQTVTFWYGNGSPTDFFALNQKVEDNNRKQYLTFEQSGSGLRLRYNRYYLAPSMNSSSKFQTVQQSGQSLLILPMTKVEVSADLPIEEQGFLVTNRPLEKETSLTVQKIWHYPTDLDSGIYEREQVTVKLLANGLDTGRSVTLSLKNNWSSVFRGLPYGDENGNPISYTVQETWSRDHWEVTYGEIIATDGSIPQYSTTVTNTYYLGGPILPNTGSHSRDMYILYGAGILLATLVYGFGARRKRERRLK